jgi:hypothetical protein
MLITLGETKLFWLQSKLDAHTLNVCKLHFENSSSKAIKVALVEQKFVQRKFDS